MSEPDTIPAMLRETVARVPDQEALGVIADGELTWWTWRQLADDVAQMAEALLELGIGPGDRVAQFAPNSHGWIVADLAILSLGGVHVPLHASFALSQVAGHVEQSDALVLLLDEPPADALRGLLAPHVIVLTHAELLADSAEPREVSPVPAPRTGDLATLLFTSGTTGRPRGVMLSHANLTGNAIAMNHAVGSPRTETRLCFLPLSHIYARTCDLYTWLYRGSRLVLAENRETILRDCRMVRPTAMTGVPYFFQKVAQRLDEAGKTGEPGALAELFGGAIKKFFCGGAAIAPQTAQIYQQHGLPVLMGYGLTETSPVVTATGSDNYVAGTVGPALPGVEIRIAEDGEILVRGPNVMQGYWEDPVATRATIIDGWLHTGDLGTLDAAGHLRSLGRRKEIIVLATGKNVSPLGVEQRLLGSVLVENVCVVGDGYRCLGALVVPNPVALKKLIRDERLWVWSRRRAVTHPAVLRRYRAEFERLLADVSREEQIGPFLLLDRNFLPERGEITTKLSLRREAIGENFAAEIEAMFRQSA